MAEDRVVYHDFTPCGNIRLLWSMVCSGNCPDEILVEGPAGSAKSRGICELIVYLCETYPNIRVLMARKTLQSMRDTILVTLEDETFPPGHPAIESSRRTQQHPRYSFPNGSEIVCYGFDDPEKIKSSQYDIVYVNEGTDLTLNDWMIATTRNRNFVLSIGQFCIIDCNPGDPNHWLNTRPKKQKMMDGQPLNREDGSIVYQMTRVKTRLDDNPKYVNQKTGEYTPEGRKYLSKLDALSGHSYRRLRLGEWCSAEGAIWNNFDSDIHVLDRFPNWINKDSDGNPIWRMVVAAADWGYVKAGVIHVYGVDEEGRMYLIREVYRAGINVVAEDRNEPSWIQWARQLQDEYNPSSWQCDPAEPGFIQQFRRAGIPATEAENDILPGIDAVRDRLNIQPDGRPRLFIMRNALRERCPVCDDANWPVGLQEEIPSYVWREIKEDKPIKDEPNPTCQDHAADTCRYAVMYVDRFFTPAGPKRKVKVKDTYGYILGHPEEDYIYADEDN